MSADLLEHKGSSVRGCQITDGSCVCSRLAKVQTQGQQSQGLIRDAGAIKEWHDFFYEICTRNGVPFTTACDCVQQLLTQFESDLNGQVEDSESECGDQDDALDDVSTDPDDEPLKKKKWY